MKKEMIDQWAAVSKTVDSMQELSTCLEANAKEWS